MKNHILLLVLIVASLGLGVALLVTKKQAAEQKEKDAVVMLNLSNTWKETSTKLQDQKQVATMLETDLDNQRKSYEDLTNSYTKVTSDFNATSAQLVQSQAALKASQEEVAKREAKINELEAQNLALDKKAIDLSVSITNLTMQIAETQRKLAASEGDKAFLEKELKRLMGEKADLERQFNDLVVLRAQVAKLKEELSIARRIEMIRQGLFANNDQKGAQRLMQGFGTPQAKPAPRLHYDLNVEVSSDGSVNVIPPGTNSVPQGTNAPVAPSPRP